MTIDRVRNALSKLHWQELSQKRPDSRWIEALREAGRTLMRLRKAT